ncbi:MAG: flagellar biosynthesis protein FlhA [Legionella sp.]|nr:MAG: flagellar biosynthesis protein FlhA [Legionella sp.]PJD96959.1 MAG: flagellar biosynthesis protein FlhA [Legionella sp.]
MSKSFSNNSSELILIAFATGILFILFIPIPAGLLDLLLIINFSWALTVMLLTFYTDKPLSFSTFPALLLMSTLFRLALNISATRLILTDAHAGKVIQATGQYVIQGNYVMGLVVFLILIIVQFIVVTNGAQRIAEVAARFTLDSMPGKQMSIDADLNMGIISHEEAKKRRATIEKEANFYGAMDGASKFVKGDAIAGILIILVDIIGGFIIGLLQKGLTLTESLHTYTLLTVGDGLVTQIPALIISTATGIIVTRAATDAHLGSEIARQISAYPKSLMLVGISLIGLLCVNGIPALPVLFCLAFISTGIWFAYQKTNTQEELVEQPESLYEQIRFYPIEMNMDATLYNALLPHQEQLLQAIQQIREQIAFDLGFVIPELKIKTDKKITFPFYQLSIHGQKSALNALYEEKVLALPSTRCKDNTALSGIAVRDPSYGLPALWIDKKDQQNAVQAGYTLHEPLTVLSTHLREYIHNHLPQLLTREETESLLMQPGIKTLSDELIPNLLSLSQVQRVLQSLLQEEVSIRYLQNILELLLEHAKKTSDPVQLVEIVRQGLAIPICQKLLNSQDSLQVLTLESSLEQTLNQSLVNKEFFALDPKTTEHLLTSMAIQVEHMLNARKKPVLLCSSQLRRHLKQLTQRVIPHLTILAMNEIPINIPVESFGVVK